MNRTLNSCFETSLRLLILLHESDCCLTEKRIAIIDFLSLYPSIINLSLDDINGSDSNLIGEYPAKSILVHEAIKFLVQRGLIIPTTSAEGFVYSLTDNGTLAVESMQSEYSRLYEQNVTEVLAFFSQKGDREIDLLLSQLIQTGEK